MRREQTDREFAEREQAIARQEQELADLRTRVEAFPKELETTVAQEVKGAVEKVQIEGKFRLELVQKTAEGEINVLQAKIASLETLIKDQSTQLAKLNEQVEKSYSQVQAIAVKAVEGSATKIVSIPPPQQRQGDSANLCNSRHLPPGNDLRLPSLLQFVSTVEKKGLSRFVPGPRKPFPQVGKVIRADRLARLYLYRDECPSLIDEYVHLIARVVPPEEKI